MGKGCRWAALTVATLGVKTVTAPVAARALTVDHLSDLSGLRLARWGLVSNPVRDFVLIRVCLWCGCGLCVGDSSNAVSSCPIYSLITG